MSQVYWLRFGDGNPQNYSGLSPTFLKFHSYTGGVVAAPGITEPITGSGLYQFTVAATFPIAFIADAATTGIVNALRYVAGSVDPVDQIDGALTNQGTTLSAIGVSLAAQGSTISGIAATLTAIGVGNAAIGSTASSFGTSTSDPVDLFGYMKRIQELLEGDQTFAKQTGSYTLYDRTGGITLVAKTVSNSTTGVTRS